MNESWNSLFFVAFMSLVILTWGQQPQPQRLHIYQPASTGNSWLIYAKLDKCKASSVFPSIGINGVEEFAADNAVRKGSGYWCSEGNHRKEDTVYWTGWLINRRLIKAIEIHWAYAPGKVSILVSYDGSENFRPITNFQSVTSSEASFDQQIFFPTPVRAKAIRIAMQDATHEYFGINLVQLIVGNSVVRLQSGITSAFQDMCIVVDESNEIVLDGCVASIANMDGRDIWIFNSQGQIVNPIKNSCIVLKDNNDAEGGTIILDDCFIAYNHADGRSTWELQKNNQLKLMKGGNFCLSQKGSKSGSSDVAINKQAVTSHPRLDDTHHGPEMVLDGNSDTFWASVDFPLDVVPDAVYLDVNLGDKYKLKSAAIFWVYPATQYKISLSADGKSWNDVGGSMANSLHNTVDNLHSSIAQYIRIAMIKPHPTLAKVGDSMLYGIKTLSVFSNRLRSIVEDCGAAAATKDARDKLFLEMVSEVDLSASNQFRLANAALLNETATVLKLTLNIEEILPSAATCLEDKKITKNKLLTARGNLGDIKEELLEIEESINQFPTKLSNIKYGYMPEASVEDCYALKLKDPLAVSGFYYIWPPCAPSPLRTFCDMSIGASYFVPPDSDILELNDVRKICSNFGMKPLQLHSTAQLTKIHTMLKLMELDLKHPVPIAVDNGTGRYFDLGLEVDVTEILLKANQANVALSGTAGFGRDGLVFFDGSAMDMSAIICSVNTDAFVPSLSYIEISCSTTIKNNPIFNVAFGQHVIVKCPENCLDTETPVIGTDVYHEESSVCLAAIHSGAFNKNGLIIVNLVEGSDEFLSCNRNGVSSDSYKSTHKQKAFKVNQLIYKCPKDSLKNNLSRTSSFLEVNVIQQFAQMGEKQLVIGSSVLNQPLDPNSSQLLDPKTGGAIKNLIMLTNMQYSAVDPSFIRNIQEGAGRTVSKARSLIKAAEKLEKSLQAESSEFILENKKFGSNLESVASKVNSRMHNAQQELTTVMAERAAQSASQSWSMEYLNPSEFYNVFEAKTTKSIIGAANWHLTNSFRETTSKRNIIAQTSSIIPINPTTAASGTFLTLRNKRYFDSILSADVYMANSGSIGLTFRVKDHDNKYLFEMKQLHGGFKRLVRVEDGKPVEIARLEDGGFLAGVWYTINIKTQQTRIMISVLEASKEPVFVAPEPIIDVIDGYFASGSIGLFACASNEAYFDNVKVEAIPCARNDNSLLPPRPPQCSNFKESYIGSFDTTWRTIEPEDAQDGPSDWKYADEIGGQRKVIVQTSSVKGSEETTPTLAILKKHRSCDKGVVTFSFFPQCEAGIVGGVFNYKNSHNYNIVELGPSFARLRRNINGQFSTYTKSLIGGYSLSVWNKISIIMNGEQITIHAGHGLSPIPLFNVIGVSGDTGGTVGLSSYNCPGVAYANFSMHPHTEREAVPDTPEPITEAFMQTESSGMEVCLRKKNIVERMEYCHSISTKYNLLQKRCKSNFCDSCCEQEFPISSKASVTCKNHCHEGDFFSSLSESALQLLHDSCSIDHTAKFYESCDKEEENDKELCLIKLCSMCCHTAQIPDKFEQSYYGKILLAQECERRCATQQSISADFEDL